MDRGAWELTIDQVQQDKYGGRVLGRLKRSDGKDLANRVLGNLIQEREEIVLDGAPLRCRHPEDRQHRPPTFLGLAAFVKDAPLLRFPAFFCTKTANTATF